MELAAGAIDIPEASFANFKSNIRRRADIAAELGARYMHVIFPDKHSVLRHEYPLDRVVAISELYKERSKDASQDVLYASDVLEGKGAVFKRTDTHLTDLGTLLVTFELVRRLGFDIPKSASKLLQKESFAKRLHVGDLGSRFDPQIGSEEIFFAREQRLRWFHNDLIGANNGIVDIRFSPDAFFEKRLMFFGNSFGRDCVRFLSFFFRQTVFLRTPFCHEDLARVYQPDIIITENVERYMDQVKLDSSRELFLMMPYLSGVTYNPSVEFARAFSAEFSYGLDNYHAHLASLERDFPKLEMVD